MEKTNPFYVDESRPWFSKEAGWPKEVPKNYDFPNLSLGDMLRESAGKWPNEPVIWFLDKYMTYAELDDKVDRMAAALHNMGLKKGDVLAIMLPNSFQYVISYYAGVRLGLIVSGVNPTYKPMEVLHQLKTIGARALIFLDALYEEQLKPIMDKASIEILIATNIADLLPRVKRTLGKLLKKVPTGDVPSNAYDFMNLLGTRPEPPRIDIDPVKDTAAYIMTGGTTGVPKAAVLTHFNCTSNCVQSRLWFFKGEAGTASIGILPLFHSFAMTAVMNVVVYFGGWMLLFPRPPQTEEFLKTLMKLDFPKGAVFCGAEVLFKRLADFERINEYDITGKVTLCVSGAGPLHRPVQEAFERVTGGKLVEGYGLTETSPVVSAHPFYEGRKIGTIGLPFTGTEWRIVDISDPHKTLGSGEDNMGELAVAGPQIMKEYLNRPDETIETIVEMDGKRWLLTGDIGFMDEGGRVYIRDRKKQLVKHKGYSVYPKEVEELVGGHEAVSEVAVAGIPDEERGEVIKAWVVLKKGYEGKITEDELLKWCQGNMTHYKVPRFIEFREDLPKSMVGKVMRRELQEADPLFIKGTKKG